ncbi:MAG: MSMEG_4193 family putative phosphomutase [Anaerolineales bacterium]
MTQFLLIRHAVNDWVKTGKLAGRTPGVHLNDHGQRQAAALGERLAEHKLHAIYTSPLERCVETAEAIAQHHPKLSVETLDGILEVGYGRWQGAKLDRLRRQKLWRNVQYHPARVQFPDGETMRGAQARAVDTIEDLQRRYPRQTVVLVFHSDVIKMVIAHYLGVHLDLFQRIMVSPASISTLVLGSGMPFIAGVNDTSHNPPEQKD